jgi:hypothetical protein
MKIIIAVLILCFSVNLITAFRWFNFGSDDQSKWITNSPTTRHRVSHPQRKNHVGNSINSHRQADSVNKKTSPIVHTNRFRAIAYQQQHRALDNRVNGNTNNRIFHPKFVHYRPAKKNNKTIITPTNQRVVSQGSLSKHIAADSKPNSASINKNNIQPNQPPSVLAASTKTSRRRVLPAKVNGNTNRHHILAHYYREQRLRPSYQHTHSNLNSALRQRRNAQHYELPMILTRDAHLSQEDSD